MLLGELVEHRLRQALALRLGQISDRRPQPRLLNGSRDQLLAQPRTRSRDPRGRRRLA
ncbi:MAG: hypothetical protein ACLP50_20780 [Solirubrobacteraceae bacterium]